MPFAAIDVGELLQAVWVSLVAGVVVTTTFALVVREGGQATVARREGRDRAAVVHVALATLFFAAFVAMVIIGVAIMLSK